jgi:hypothetical protein
MTKQLLSGIDTLVYSIATFGDRGKHKSIQAAAGASEIPESQKNAVAKNNKYPSRRSSQQQESYRKEDGYVWQAISYVYDPIKKEIWVHDKEFVLVKLQDYQYQFKTHNGRMYALLPPPVDTDDGQESVSETEEKGIL